MHFEVSTGIPLQVLPKGDGGGLLHSLYRERIPTSFTSTLHLLQTVQSDHPPSLKKTRET